MSTSNNTKFEIMTFDGKNVIISEEQKTKLAKVLLPSGRFIEIGGNIINISDIRGIYKSGFSDDVRTPDYLKEFNRSNNATSLGEKVS